MKKRNQPRIHSASVHGTPATLLYILITIACAAFLATGFFFAARQHFASIDLGMKNSELRKQVEEMEAQNRQLVLAREMVRSPGEVKRNAIHRGFRERDAAVATVVSTNLDRAKPLVDKTSSVKPTDRHSERHAKIFVSEADKKPTEARKEAKKPVKFGDAMAVHRSR